MARGARSTQRTPSLSVRFRFFPYTKKAIIPADDGLCSSSPWLTSSAAVVEANKRNPPGAKRHSVDADRAGMKGDGHDRRI
jgi:hypothetical protein